MKAFYLCYFVAVATYTPYLSLYLRAIHLNGSQIGLIASLSPLVGVVLPPFWGTLSDRFGWRKRLLSLSLLVVALVAPTVALAHTFGALLALVGVLAIALSPAAPLADATTLDWLRCHGDSGGYGAVRVYGSFGYTWPPSLSASSTPGVASCGCSRSTKPCYSSRSWRV